VYYRLGFVSVICFLAKCSIIPVLVLAICNVTCFHGGFFVRVMAGAFVFLNLVRKNSNSRSGDYDQNHECRSGPSSCPHPSFSRLGDHRRVPCFTAIGCDIPSLLPSSLSGIFHAPPVPKGKEGYRIPSSSSSSSSSPLDDTAVLPQAYISHPSFGPDMWRRGFPFISSSCSSSSLLPRKLCS